MYGRCYLSCAWNFGCTPFPFSFLLNLNISISLNGANVPTYLMGIYNVSSSIVAVTSGRNCMFLGSLRHYGSAYGIAPVLFLLWIRGIDDSTLWRERCGSTTMSMRKKNLNSCWVSWRTSMAIAIRILSCYMDLWWNIPPERLAVVNDVINH